jgi:hypothetical protein
MPTVEQLADLLREGSLVTRADAWTLAERVHAAYPQQAQPVPEPAALSDERIAELTGLDYGNPDWRIEYDKYRAVIAADRKLRATK